MRAWIKKGKCLYGLLKERMNGLPQLLKGWIFIFSVIIKVGHPPSSTLL